VAVGYASESSMPFLFFAVHIVWNGVSDADTFSETKISVVACIYL